MDMTSQVQELEARLLALGVRRTTCLERLNSYQSEILKEKESILHLTEVSSVLKKILDVLSGDQLSQLNELVSFGLNAVFESRSLEFKLVVEERRGVKQLDPYYKDAKIHSDWVYIDDSTGGGLLSVIAFILQLYYTAAMNYRPVLFLDEFFNPLSVDLQPRMMSLIQYLVSEFQMDVLLVTHSSISVDMADSVYRVNDGKIVKVR